MALIGSILGAAGGGLAGLAGGILGSRSAQRGYREALEEYNDRLDQIRTHRDRLYYQDPTQSAESQAALSQAREVLNEQSKRASAVKAVTGGTDESAALQKESAAKAVGDMIQQQALSGALRREGIWNQADNEIDRFTNYIAQTKLNKGLAKAKAISDTAQSLGKSSVELGGLLPL